MACILYLFTITLANASNNEDTHRVFLFFGRFHLLILHLPIGALLLTFFLDIIGRIQKKYPKTTVQYALGFSSFFAILTCILGYFLSLEGGYKKSVIDIHFWTGILSGILITTLFLLSRKGAKRFHKIFFPFFILTLVCVSIAGHFGSVLTHGNNFLTAYAEAPPKMKAIKNIDSLKLFDDVVLKIIKNKCTQCHNATKRKGKLSLLSRESILKGGESGSIIISGNAEESLLYKQLLLPISDKEHMPPKGKPQLTKDELWLLKYWINHQMNFKDKVATMPKDETLTRSLKPYLVFTKIKIKEASPQDIQKVRNAGFSVLKLVPNQPELSVKFQKGVLTNDKMSKLGRLKEQIVELDLSNSDLSDQMTTTLNKIKNLKKLRLDRTKITDKSLQNLHDLKNLKSVNLYRTKIGNNGLKNLVKMVDLEKIYVWETNVEASVAEKLESKFATKIYKGIDKDFVEITRLKTLSFSSKKTLFTDTITIKLGLKSKNSAIYYTLNGEEPDSTSLKYKNQIAIDSTVNLKVKAFKKGWLPSETLTQTFFKIQYKVTDYTLVDKPDSRYPGAGKLFDLEEGSLSFRDGKWIGYLDSDINVTIDLGKLNTVKNISINCLENIGNRILFPAKLIAYTSSNKNFGFKRIGELNISKGKNNIQSKIKKVTLKLSNTTSQYFKIIIKNPKLLPNWKEGSDKESWIFVDEIYLW